MLKTTLIIEDDEIVNDGETTITSFVPICIDKATEHDYVFSCIAQIEHNSFSLLYTSLCIFKIQYEAENIYDEMNIEKSPLFYSNIRVDIIGSVLIQNLKTYITDLEFHHYESIRDIDEVYLYAIYIEDKGKCKFKVSNELYASMKYFDNIVGSSMEYSDREFEIAVLNSNANIYIGDCKFLVVDDIVNIMSLVKDKDPYIVMASIKILTLDGESGNRDLTPYTVIMTVDLPFKVNRRKLGKTKIENIKRSFEMNPDQYKYQFSFCNKFRNNDEGRYIIKCTNKDGDNKLFVFDDRVQEKIINLIEEKYK